MPYSWTCAVWTTRTTSEAKSGPCFDTVSDQKCLENIGSCCLDAVAQEVDWACRVAKDNCRFSAEGSGQCRKSGAKRLSIDSRRTRSAPGASRGDAYQPTADARGSRVESQKRPQTPDEEAPGRLLALNLGGTLPGRTASCRDSRRVTGAARLGDLGFQSSVALNDQ